MLPPAGAGAGSEAPAFGLGDNFFLPPSVSKLSPAARRFSGGGFSVTLPSASIVPKAVSWGKARERAPRPVHVSDSPCARRPYRPEYAKSDPASPV